MASLREQFGQFYQPDEDAVAHALRTGLVTPDTNVLLSLYRFQPEARDELFSALQVIGDRLWIPHQVGLEFHRNRLNVIASQESYFSKTSDQLESKISAYLEELRSFVARISLTAPIAEHLEKMIKKAHEEVKQHVIKAGEANEIHLDNRDSDEVLSRLEALFTDRVGDPMKLHDLETARKEALRRIKDKIPPGYMDRDKPDPTGDYLIWRQLITYAAKRKLPVTFITDDRKEDWYRREHGLTLGARYELREEMLSEAGVPFLVLTTPTFLIHAGKYLHVSVSPETVSQAKELPDDVVTERMLRDIEQDYKVRMNEFIRMRGETERDILTVEEEVRALSQELADITYILDKEGSPDDLLIKKMTDLRARLAYSKDNMTKLEARRDTLEVLLADRQAELIDISKRRRRKLGRD